MGMKEQGIGIDGGRRLEIRVKKKKKLGFFWVGLEGSFIILFNQSALRLYFYF